MRLIVPVSYFDGEPQSDFFVIDTVTKAISQKNQLEKHKFNVSGKGVTSIARYGESHYVACDFNHIYLLDKALTTIKQTSLPDFNDLHHITVFNGHIWVVNTGRDSIDVFDSNFKLVERIDFLTDQERLDRESYGDEDDAYYDSSSVPFNMRKIKDKFHLNHVQFISELEPIATSFASRSFLTNKETTLSAPFENSPHDGFIYEGYLWCTTVDGGVFRAALGNSLEFENVFNVFDLAGYVGWCRGLFLKNGILFVGITQIKQQNSRTKWFNGKIKNTKTGVYEISLKEEKVSHFYDLTSVSGSRIFTLIEQLCDH